MDEAMSPAANNSARKAPAMTEDWPKADWKGNMGKTARFQTQCEI
jgi:hypothetical protein